MTKPSPQITPNPVMERHQQTTSHAEFTCSGCGKVASRAVGFFSYGFQYCSLECLTPLRIRAALVERTEEGEREAKRRRVGDFTFTSGASTH